MKDYRTNVLFQWDQKEAMDKVKKIFTKEIVLVFFDVKEPQQWAVVPYRSWSHIAAR